MKNYEQYLQLRSKIAAYQLALATLHWDGATIAPKAGASYRAQKMGVLSGEMFSIMTDPSFIQILNDALEESLNDVQRKEIKQSLKNVLDIVNVPKETYIEFVTLQSEAEHIWEVAKSKNDYQMFKPYLSKLIEMSKIIVSFRDSKLDPYEQLLDDFEENMRSSDYDAFFNEVREKLVPFIQKVLNSEKPAPAFLSAYVSEDEQKKLIDYLAPVFDYSLDTGAIAKSVHPFSSHFSAHDNRVTVRYLTNQMTSSVFAFIHEVGHATYNGQVNSEFEGLTIAQSMTYGLHESQSRLFENLVGKSYAFWKPHYENVQNIVSVLKNVTLDEFIFGINYVEQSFIRVEADELTYPLHIMLRYELEKALFDGTLSVDDLPQVWNEKFKAYLNLDVLSDDHGVLQDVHWSGAAFGYFPTYALGSAYGAMFFEAMGHDIDVEAMLLNNDFKSIKTWLKENIHQYGGLYNGKELIEKVCKKPFSAHAYVEGLITKYSKLFQL
jgi:carboxypeptidase Taq